MLVLIYTTLFILISSFFYLSLTVSHVYLYFFIIVLSASILKKYLYVTYVIYLNFYWVFCALLVFYSLTYLSVIYVLDIYINILYFF